MKARLIISVGWFLSNIHRFWNNSIPVDINPFLLFDEFPITVQWYVYLLFSKLFPAFILLAAYYGIRKEDYRYYASVFVLELINYFVCYSESELILLGQGILLSYIYLKDKIKWK